ncbi:MAG: EF-hand domain-containing protein [Planctomycetota bacterium]|jgi:Ca2+-binding EF-hand superfamily protein
MRSALLCTLLTAACAATRPPPEKEPETAPPPIATEEASVWEYLSAKYDKDGDGAVAPQEYDRGAESFARVDRDKDGSITEADFRAASRMHVMMSQMMIMRTMQADGDSAQLERGELKQGFLAQDTDANGELDRAEVEAAQPPGVPEGMDVFKAMENAIDADKSTTLSLAEIEAFFDSIDDGDGVWMRRGAGKKPAAPPTGAPVGEVAPDFTLRPPEGGEPVTLSKFRGDRPVALIFGSYS